jgi:hypothetical protein
VLNLARVERLIAEGKMKPAGLAAWANYEKFPPGYRRTTAGWVANAKKEETRSKRLEKLIDFSALNERIEFM